MITTARYRKFCLILLLLASTSGCRPAAEPPARLPRVTVAHPEVRQLRDEDDYNGWLQASQTVDVRAQVRGHIEKIDFKDGDLVTKGQKLIELDARPFIAARNAARAQEDALKAKEAAAKKNVARTSELLTRKAISQSEFEQIEADALALGAEINAKAQEVARDDLDIEYSLITAPIGGRIGRAMLTEGNLVNAGGTDPVLATIVDADPIYVYFNIDERSLQRYQKSDVDKKDRKQASSLRELKLPFSFGLDTDKGFPHDGTIDFANNKVDQSTGTIEVRGVAPNPGLRLVSGARVRVRMPVSDKYQALLVPDTCVLTDQDRRYLLVLGKDNVVLRRDVALGRLLDDGMRVVLGPAEEGGPSITAKDWVITLGLQRARVNYPVEPFDADGKVVK